MDETTPDTIPERVPGWTIRRGNLFVDIDQLIPITFPDNLTLIAGQAVQVNFLDRDADNVSITLVFVAREDGSERQRTQRQAGDFEKIATSYFRIKHGQIIL